MWLKIMRFLCLTVAVALTGCATTAGDGSRLLTQQQQRISNVAEEEGVNVEVTEYVLDGKEIADLGLEYDWYGASNSSELSASGKDKLKRLISASKVKGETENLQIILPYTARSTGARLLAQRRVRIMRQCVQENNWGIPVIAEGQNFPVSPGQIIIR